MGKNEFIFDVRINISDEVAETCIAALNNWLEDGNRRLEKLKFI